MPQRHHSPACHWCAVSLSVLLAVFLPLQSKADAPRLSHLWLEQHALPEAPAYSYYLLTRHQAPQQRQARRLQQELATLSDWYSLAGHTGAALGLRQWQTALAELEESPGRTPGRADLAALLASPQHDPLQERLAEVGHCVIPNWIELWHFGGVTRHRWTPGLSLGDLLRRQPRSHWSRADEAWLIAPQSEPRRIGIAAWNAGDAPLAAGSRIALALPEPVQEADWINRALPGFLATRLPGDTCHTIELPDVADRAGAGGSTR
ncbi:hypothetical protein HOP51_02455 [Halomonas sp. MCCC 1A11036]|uniref:Capsule biosynthesis GfcC-like C-terminal domain-containing protein n=1 Tax=Billgrantia zhangzhouensis TaxID=2733481 RepID=A0ABS9AAT2_9GAMM|nr:capsule biosynthesis GfcC family protein [Halomonas zhangzhouensis]MCE8018984.1 hypothetical protein [Halomonas zhangzhouensis]